jgi:hypothetical protein
MTENFRPKRPVQRAGLSGADATLLSVDEALRSSAGEEWLPGRALSMMAANTIAARSRATVIALAGGTKSGKTTLFTSIYEYFLQEPIGDYLFAGSETLFGFEERCFFNRVASGRTSPGMRTTGLSDPPWLHLTVRRGDLKRPSQDLLLADLSGGWFEGLVDGTVEAEQLPHIGRADHLSLVIDGGRIAKLSDRDEERSRIEHLARILLEGDMLASPQVLSLLITKWDKVAKAGAEAEEYADKAVDRITKFVGFGKRIPSWRVAARPETNAFPIGHGVPSLFLHWVESAGYVRQLPPKPDPNTVALRPFQRFKPGHTLQRWCAR